MAWTVTSALIGSLLFSLTLVPLLCWFLLRKNLPHEENAVMRFAHDIYEPVLRSGLARPWAVVITAVATLVASLAVLPRVGTEFLPELNEGTIWVNANLPPGISVNEAVAQTGRIRQLLHTVPEVKTVISKAGRPEDGTDPKPINMAECFVDLKPPSAWTRHITKAQLIEQMDQALDALPGVETSFSQPIRDNVLESISQIDGQIAIKIFAEDGALIREKAQEVLRTITPVRGVARAFIDRAGEVPQLQIEIDRQRAARYGLNSADIQDVIETALGGKVATEIWEGEKRFGVVVQLREEERRDITAIKNILVDTPGGVRVPLEQVATVTVQSGSMNISREGGMRVAALGVFIRGRDMGSVVQEMQQRVQANVAFPPGCFVTWGGE